MTESYPAGTPCRSATAEAPSVSSTGGGTGPAPAFLAKADLSFDGCERGRTGPRPRKFLTVRGLWHGRVARKQRQSRGGRNSWSVPISIEAQCLRLSVRFTIAR